MYGHTFSNSMDQPGKITNPTRGQLNRENYFFPVRVPALNRVATKVRTYFEMRTDGQRFLCLKSRISILRRYL